MNNFSISDEYQFLLIVTKLVKEDYACMRLIIFILKSLLFLILTILTQIGGLVYLLSLLISFRIKKDFKSKIAVLFMVLYALSTFIIVPILAPLFGREKVVQTEMISPTNYMTVLLNRNYVKPELNELLLKASDELRNTNPKIKINYLDANFPFMDGFPLLPHLSHNDGKKIDISLVYESEGGEITHLQKSRSGYGAFVEPKKHEYNQTKICKEAGYFQYDFPKYLTLGRINSNLKFSKKGTKQLIISLLKHPDLGKVFIEPHLKARMKLTNNKIRFHGCGAVRHDDHIHIQL